MQWFTNHFTIKVLQGIIFLCALYLFVSCQPKEKLLFASSRNGNSDIYIMNSDGTGLHPLTNAPQNEWAPSLISPIEITFLRDDNSQVNRIKLNLRTGREQILKQPELCDLDDKNALYIERGKKEVYECDGEIILRDHFLNKEINLTANLDAFCFKPSWFPDGTKIAFAGNSGGQSDIYFCELGTGDIINFTNSPANEEHPGISFDGRNILYSSYLQGDDQYEIHIVEISSHHKIKNIQTPGIEAKACWSKSGGIIYIENAVNGNYDIYAYQVVENLMNRITNDPGFDGDPQPL